uniref:SJCHGC02272 protein n=1 Tax=Schistosoma japonicum TaxID=6182 RepID=Q5DC87_SCHJA|nr:SJCHGC02272 protein [Schistosoma japonicum]
MDCTEVSLGDIEFKGPHAQVNVTVTRTTHFPLLSYFSDWTKPLRTTSWLRRYIDYMIVLYSRHKERVEYVRRTGVSPEYARTLCRLIGRTMTESWGYLLCYMEGFWRAV